MILTKMNVTGYSFDPIGNVLTCSDSFLKKASCLNSPEYDIVRRFRTDIPDVRIVRSTKKQGDRPLAITFAKMEGFIARCRDAEKRLEQFGKVKALSKIQVSPYQYVRTWFLNNYANYSEQPVFDDEGFLIVKTRSELEAEKKAQKEAEESKNDSTAEYATSSEQAS